jgi:class 3 adenylate cyclase/tetratricopeptide (TPR) repeat protein/DNA-binding XRE family transcriptional regulator
VSREERRGTFAELLRQHRLAAGLTQEALADRAGLSVRGIADLERGARRYPHFDTLHRLAHALELAPAGRVALLTAGQRPAQPDPAGAAAAPKHRCDFCGRGNTPDAGFCVECGQALAVPCPACGAPGGLNDRFCHACGASRTARPGGPAEAQDAGRAAESTVHPERGVASEGEHKQATILYCQLADGAGLARRLGTDGMLAFLDSFFEQAEAEVRRFEGTISSFLSDGLVALFGVPVAHEDHARRGVLTALGLQRRLADTPAGEDAGGVSCAGLMRMALATGLVAVSQVGTGPERRLRAVGETTTIAGLLQQQAEPGTIVIGPATARLVAGYVRLEDLGPLPLPGASGPVQAFRVTGTGPRRSPIEGLGARPLSRFVGREPEMRALRDVLDQVTVAPELSARPKLAEFIGRDHALAALRGPLAKAEAGQGQVVGIVGEPGIGKSRLLFEFRRSLAGRQITYLEGRCLSFGGSVPYLPIVDVVRANCGIVETDPPEVVVQKVRFGLQEVGLNADRHAPYVLHLLGLGEGVTVLSQLSAEAVKSRMFETLRTWSLHGSRRRPLIIAVEDLHWVDRSSEEYLASLAECLAGAPILLMCTWRPGYRPPWAEHSYVTQLGLRRLGPRDSLGLVSSVLGEQEVPGELAQVILERGEGNPFFLEELARAVADRSAVESASFVPDTIQDVLMARIDRLDETPRQLLQTASVVGREVPLRLLAALWPRPAELGEQLRTLQNLEFLYEQAGREPGFVFKHALTQDVAYATLLESRKRALHAAAGRALENLHADRLEEVYDRLAYHYARTDDAAKAVRYLTAFAGRAPGMPAHADAARALEDALGHIARLLAGEKDKQLVATAVRLAASYYFLGRFRDTVELLEGQRGRLGQLDDETLAGQFFFELAHAHSHLGDYQQAVAYAERAIEAAQRGGDPSAQGKAHYVLCKESMWVARFGEGLDHGRRAVSHLEGTGERWWLGQSLCWQGINLYFMGDLNAALECAAGGFAIGEELGDHRLQSYAAWNRAWFSATRGDGQEAVTWGHRSIELSPDPLNNAFSLGWTGYAYLENGDPARAISLLERSIELLEGMRYSRLVGWFKGWLAGAYLLTGDLTRARAEATAGLEISTSTRFTWAVGLAQRALGTIVHAEGDAAGAARHLTEALQTFEATQSRFDAARTHLELARLADEHGPRADAAAHRRAAHRLLTALGLPAGAAAADRAAARSAAPGGHRNR